MLTPGILHNLRRRAEWFGDSNKTPLCGGVGLLSFFKTGRRPLEFFLETLGDYGVICWMVDFENLASVELAGQVLDADEGYQERLQAASELLLGGTFDKVYSSVD